jgi:Spy/CpxP family protein refolding chaperone
MKKILILAGIILILATPAILADDDAPEAQTTKEVRVVEMRMDDDMGPMMGMKCGDMGSGMGMGRGMMKGCCGDDGMGPGMGMCCNLLDCKELNLTKEQVQKIKDINFAHKNAMIDLKAALEKAQLRMGQQMRDDSPDKAKALAAVKEVSAAKAQMAEARITHMFNLRGVLTTEQLEKVKACRDGGMCGGKGEAKGCGGKAAGTPCGKPCPGGAAGAAACGKGK